jgi:aspartyl-tRNA(Asn)/glutamyl-tRNA(Gln) amidotransferase subunit B
VPEIEALIGLEVHAQLSTSSKLFCRCGTAFGEPANSLVCPVCLGLPGSLPVVNMRAVEMAAMVGLALGCRVNPISVFARKSYFYPDLPKGYQISQYDRPLCEGGEVTVSLDGAAKRVRLIRIHLEEDAGKSLHSADAAGGFSLVDFNRCGVPLIEVVTEPEITSPREAVACLEAVKQVLEYLDVCDGDMEKGNLRVDSNVSVRQRATGGMGANTEIKNLNSFKNLESALSVEIARQSLILSGGGRVIRQTLLWDETQRECVPMRAKEEAHDYRYFPEPDLPPLMMAQELVTRLRDSLPEPPWRRRQRFESEYKLPAYDAALLTSAKAIADYYEECVKAGAGPKLASNWVMTDVLRAVKDVAAGIAGLKVGPAGLAELLKLLQDGVISGSIAKSVFAEMIRTGDGAYDITMRRGLVLLKDKRLIESAATRVVDSEYEAVERWVKGEEKTFEFLVGKVMAATSGRADPRLVREALRAALARAGGGGR